MNDYERARVRLQAIQTTLQLVQILVTMGIPFVMYYINTVLNK